MRIVRSLWGSSSVVYKKHPTAISILVVTLFVVLVNFTYIFITNPDPLISRSGLPVQNGKTFASLPFAGGNSIEGNDGITKQAVGIQAVHQIFNGNFPLWNHYEGIGAPLLGETQSAALFPFTLLLALPYGFLLNQIVLELIAGIGMYLFVRHLRNGGFDKIGNTAAITAGCLYATLGTFMMTPSAGFNPIPFLPWSMLGVTLLFLGEKKRFLSPQNVLAMLVFALSMALSLLAGFPETAALNLLLVAVYATILFAKTNRQEKLARAVSLFLAGFVALLLALPWLMEFFTYINPTNGSTGIHNTSVLLDLTFNTSTSVAYLSSFIPNVIGFDTTNPVYGGIGGFFTVSSLILAILAMFSKNIALRWKLLFGGWFLLGWMRIVGVPFVMTAIAHIPMIGQASVFRYITPSLSFCLIVLVALSVSSVKQYQRENLKVIVGIVASTLIFYGFMLIGGWQYLKDFIKLGPQHAIFATFFLELSVLASAAVLVALLLKWKYKKQFICLVLIVESALCFAVWQFGAYSKTATVDTSSVKFLQQNLGTQRFDSNMLNANYGSYFDISQLSMRDLPIPTLWYNYLVKHFDTFDASIGFLYNEYDSDRIAKDEELGVRYLLVSTNYLPKKVVQERHLTLVYADEHTEIFELPRYKQYVSGNNCLVKERSDFDRFTINCTKPSQLTRLELFYPGWHAEVDGKEVGITKTNELFQQIDVPEGEHEIVFSYWPKYMTLSLVLSGVGVASILTAITYLAVCKIRSSQTRK